MVTADEEVVGFWKGFRGTERNSRESHRARKTGYIDLGQRYKKLVYISS